VPQGLIGKPVKVRRGPATVTGYESQKGHCCATSTMGRYGK